MAQFQAVFGTLRGSIDNVTTRDWNGINVMARKPQSYTDANTEVQQDNRAIFKATAKMVSALLPLIRVGFKGFRTKTTPYAQAVKDNLPAVRQIANGVDFASVQLILSRGAGLPITGERAIVNPQAGTTVITFDPTVGGDGRTANDRIYVAQVALNTSKNLDLPFMAVKVTGVSLGTTVRGDGRVEVQTAVEDATLYNEVFLAVFTVSSVTGEPSPTVTL